MYNSFNLLSIEIFPFQSNKCGGQVIQCLDQAPTPPAEVYVLAKDTNKVLVNGPETVVPSKHDWIPLTGALNDKEIKAY